MKVLYRQETACCAHFTGKKQHVWGRLYPRKNCHVVERFADKKQHIRGTFREERAWRIKAICTEETVCWNTVQGRDDVLTCDKDVAIWTTFCTGDDIYWRFRQPRESMVRACCGLLERSMLKVFCRKEMRIVT